MNNNNWISVRSQYPNKGQHCLISLHEPLVVMRDINECGGDDSLGSVYITTGYFYLNEIVGNVLEAKFICPLLNKSIPLEAVKLWSVIPELHDVYKSKPSNRNLDQLNESKGAIKNFFEKKRLNNG